MTNFSAKMDDTFKMSGKQFAKFMRRYGWTIRALAGKTGLTMKRIRRFRNQGITGLSLVDLHEAITGDLTPHMRACFRFYRLSGECVEA